MPADDGLEFSLDGALAARHLIDELFDQAKEALERSLKEENRAGWEYWLERVVHLMSELNKVDLEIWKLRVVDENHPSK